MKKLICCLCHCHTIGRQWPASVAGFGICTTCADQLRDIVSSEAMRDMYGIQGTHYACSPTEAQCDSLLAEAVAKASQTSELAFQCVRAPHKTIEELVALASSRAAAGENFWDITREIVEGYNLGWQSANHRLIEQAAKGGAK